MLSDKFIIIRDFIQNEISQDPIFILGTESWQKLLSVSEVYEKEKERRECCAQQEKIDWESSSLAEAVEDLKCEQCGSSLLMPINSKEQHKCRSFSTIE